MLRSKTLCWLIVWLIHCSLKSQIFDLSYLSISLQMVCLRRVWHLQPCSIMLLWFCQPYSVSLMFSTPAPTVGLIKTISRTKEGGLLCHTSSRATDMVPKGHSCQGLALHRRRRWIYQPPTTNDEHLRGKTVLLRWAFSRNVDAVKIHEISMITRCPKKKNQNRHSVALGGYWNIKSKVIFVFCIIFVCGH